jgi:outer membrane biosynthesis protein TonB
MKLGLSLALFLTACATTGTTTMDREPAQRAKVELDLASPAEQHAVFPTLQAPRLPSVDRMARQVRAQLGDEALASIELCVAADGHVTKIELLEGTSYQPFNDALVRDIEQWQFASMPGSTATKTLQTCERATVKYIAPM